VLAGERGEHIGEELAALTAALITMSRYATLHDRNNTPNQDKSKIETKTGAVLNHSPESACSFDVACGRCRR